MLVTFVLGRAGAGKTRYGVDALLSALAAPDDQRRLILLVPEQASLQMERTLATRAERGGYWRAEVLSFSRLARRVVAQAGAVPSEVSPTARRMALHLVAARMGESLAHYRAATTTAGFFAQLDRLIEELLREAVTPEQLRAAAPELEDSHTKRKVAELAGLYRGYLDWLGPERLDVALAQAAVRERLAGLAWLRDASVWVDGFAGFTGQELSTLAALAGLARDVTVTLLLDPASPPVRSADHPPDPLSLFARTERTYQQLVKRFVEAGVPIREPVCLHPRPLPRFTAAPRLAQLEAGLATPTGVPIEGSAPPSDDEHVRILECGTHREELAEAARFIRAKVSDSDGKLRFRDFAVIARDLEPFAPLVAEVFAEYELPYFLDRRRPLRAHPLSRLVEALFGAVREDFSVAAMTRLLRTDLLPLRRAQAEALETLVVTHAIRGIAAWRQPTWDYARERLDHSPQRQPGTYTPPPAACDRELDAIRLRVVVALDPLLDLTDAGPQPSGAVWARTLVSVLESLGVRQRVADWIAESQAARHWEQAETHRLAWESLCAVLADLDDVLGAAALSEPEVASVLTAALREQTLGLAPPALDQVLVSEIERSRHPDIKHAWLFAFNEGVFPARPPEDDLLNATERAALTGAGLSAPASHQEDVLAERLLAYIACTRPACGLTISYARAGDDGSPRLPSPLLDDIKRALPDLNVRRPDSDAPPVCVAEFARRYLCLRAHRAARPRAWARYERLRTQMGGASQDAARLAWLLRGTAYRNGPESVPIARAAGETGVAWNGSPSEIETYLDCSYKHFAKHRLRVDPARGPRPVSWDLGSIAHTILADVTRQAMEQRGGVRALSDETWQALLRDAIAGFERSCPPDLAARRPELVFLSRRLYQFLSELVLAHADRWRRGRFEPLACEQPFGISGLDGAWPVAEWQTADGARVRLHGWIDRVDRCRDGPRTLLLVYDYKSSPATLSGDFLTGARLQLFSYLLAVEQACRDEPHAVVVGALVAPLYPDATVLERQYARDAAPPEQRMFLYRPRGLFSRAAAPLLDTQLGPQYSPVAGMKLKKDGDFDRRASADVVPAEEIEARLELAKQTVLHGARGIVAGQVEAAPLVEKRTLACRRCEYQPLCRFDRALNRVRPAEAVLPTLPRGGANVEAPRS